MQCVNCKTEMATRAEDNYCPNCGHSEYSDFDPEYADTLGAPLSSIQNIPLWEDTKPFNPTPVIKKEVTKDLLDY